MTTEIEPAAATDMITSKAIMVAKAANLDPSAAAPGGTIFSIILGLLQTFLGCIPPTQAQVHRALTNPGPVHRKALKRTVAAHVPDVGLRPVYENGVRQVGGTLTVEESNALYLQATGSLPRTA